MEKDFLAGALGEAGLRGWALATSSSSARGDPVIG